MNSEVKYLTVTALNKYLHHKFDSDIHLKRVYIQGEISNFRISGGHGYFVLKDQDAEISGIIFASVLQRTNFKIQDGMSVLIEGQVTLYQKRGTISLQVLKVTQEGLGELYRKFLALKEMLQEEGLFEERYKQAIPEFCEKIGVITSATGDALHDVVSTIGKRFPVAHIYLFPSLVQGQDAPSSLIRCIHAANLEELDVLILARGGGTVEDLFCFNDELLARTIFHSKIPIVTGVGHESDYTIADFVADYRAPTPTGAAVKVTPDRNNLLELIQQQQTKLQYFIKQQLTNKYQTYQTVINSPSFLYFKEAIERKEASLEQLLKDLQTFSPLKVILRHIDTVKSLSERVYSVPIIQNIGKLQNEIIDKDERIHDAFLKQLQVGQVALQGNIDKLILLNPLHIMQKGYTISKQEDRLIPSVSELDQTKPLDVYFHDGQATTIIQRIRKDKP